jgi:hypothetical protein
MDDITLIWSIVGLLAACYLGLKWYEGSQRRRVAHFNAKMRTSMQETLRKIQ